MAIQARFTFLHDSPLTYMRWQGTRLTAAAVLTTRRALALRLVLHSTHTSVRAGISLRNSFYS